MWPLKSIMSRIVFMHIAAVIAAAVLLRFVLYWSLESDVGKLQQSAMRAQADIFARHLTKLSDGTWSLDLPPGIRDQYSEAYGRYEYAILDAQGATIFSSHRAHRPLYSVDREVREISYFKAPTPGGGLTISGASLPMEFDGKPIWIQVAEDVSHRDVLVDDVATNFFHQVAWVIVPVLLLLLLADIVIFRLAVRPLHRASDLASHISPTRIDVRLPVADIPREILPLVTAVNQALDRLERGFRAQREFAADAAHELRTPLAILRTRIETLPESDTARVLRRDIESMSRVVSQLLDAAELETIVIDGNERADLHDVCVEVVELIAPLALKQGKTIELNGTDRPVLIRGNSEMLLRAIRNLAENALNHTPERSMIEVVVSAGGVVTVLDQGEGIDPEDRELIFRRFWRRNRRGSGGAGLGLSIAKRIVEVHGGTISIENRPEGGAKFSMAFPLADPAASPS
ncbi:MAG TPA: ATP-binding protein [Pseudolabrys sp.]|nr:ATP-binding protein [Pseudolabrys sp.]